VPNRCYRRKPHKCSTPVLPIRIALGRRRAGRAPLQLLVVDPVTAPAAVGMSVIDDTGDRKKGRATNQMAHRYLGSADKIANGIPALTTPWAQ